MMFVNPLKKGKSGGTKVPTNSKLNPYNQTQTFLIVT